MPSKPQRITNGQRAAVCGLVLAGVPLTHAAKIVGAPIDLISEYLPDIWRVRKIPCRRWKGDELAELREAYADPAQRTETIAARYGVSISQISKLARRHGWPRRRRGHPNTGEITIRAMTPQQRTIYFKMRRTLRMPHLSAIAEATR